MDSNSILSLTKSASTMKSKFLKLDQACSEKWKNMIPNEEGSFCDSCAKNVIDLTHLDSIELSQKLANFNSSFCARVTKSQLNTPVLPLTVPSRYSLPYSNLMSGLMIATAITATSNVQAETVNNQTEFVQTSGSSIKAKKAGVKKKMPVLASNDYTVLKGYVLSKATGDPIENAKITFVTIHKLFSVSTSKDGWFYLKVPTEYVDGENLIQVSFEGIEVAENDRFFGYGDENYVFSKEDLNHDFEFKAEREVFYLGGMGFYRENYSPIVFINGKRVDYKEFEKARMGEKSSCSLENKSYMHFYGKEAKAIYGEEAKDGLYLLFDEEKD